MRKHLKLQLIAAIALILSSWLPSKPFSESSVSGAASNSVDPSGAYRTSIPVEVPPYHGLEPAINLAYNSNSGNGWLGVGWDLTGFSSIRRVSPGKGAPRYDSSDIFLLDGMELIRCTSTMVSPSCKYPASPNYIAYTTKIESFQRIAFNPAWTASGGWHVWTKTGTKMTYEARAYKSALGAFAWNLVRVEDTQGNKVAYTYWHDGNAPNWGEEYIYTIIYNGTLVKFYYESRPTADVNTHAIGGDLVTTRYRLKAIDVQTGSARVRAYALNYSVSTATDRSLLQSVQQFGTDAIIDKDAILCATVASGCQYGAVTGGTALPAFQFQSQTPVGDMWDAIDLSEPDWGLPQDGGPLPSIFNGLIFRTPTVLSDTPAKTKNITYTEDFDGDGQDDWALVYPNVKQSGEITGVGFVTALAAKSEPEYVYHTLPWNWETPFAVSSYPADVNGDRRTDFIHLIRELDYTTAAKDQADLPLHLIVAVSQGDGTFVWATSSPQAAWIQETEQSAIPHFDCKVGDVNGDNRDDFVCNMTVKGGKQQTNTAFSLGNGTFDIQDRILPLFWAPYSVHPMAIGDVNGDGLSDVMLIDETPCLALNCTDTWELVTGLSQGDGNYQFERSYTGWEKGSGFFVAADINGDARADYVIIKNIPSHRNAPDGTLLTALSQPDGSFLPAQQAFPAAGSQEKPIILMGDANGDGKTDLLVASYQIVLQPNCSTSIPFNHVNVHRVFSNGDGTFQFPASWQDCQQSTELGIVWQDVWGPGLPEASDVNGDGTADFVLAVKGPGDYTAIYEDLSPHPTGDTFNWMPAEVNGDGRTDFVYIRSTSTGPLIETMIAAGDSYVDIAQSPIPGTRDFSAIHDYRVMDVNGDGRDDLVYVQFRSPTDGSEVYTWFSEGNGNWHGVSRKVITFDMTGKNSNTLNWIPMEVNGDGKMDLVYVEPASNRLHILESNGDGSWKYNFYTFWPGLFDGTVDQNWIPIDMNGDGKSDLAQVMRFGSGLRVMTLFNQGNSSWLPIVKDPLPNFTQSDIAHWRPMHINNDGMTDLVHLSVDDRRLGQTTTLHINSLIANGDGSWTTPQTNHLGVNSIADLQNWKRAKVNDDNLTDLVHIQNLKPGISTTVLLAIGNGKWTLAPSPSDVWPGLSLPNAVFWKVVDTDGDDQNDLVGFDIQNPGMRIATLRANLPLDVLENYTSSLGAKTHITYQPSSISIPSTSSQGCHLPVGAKFHTVAEIEIFDGRNNTPGKESYNYNCPHWSNNERRFLSWESVTATSKSSDNRPESTTYRLYKGTDECLVQPTYEVVRDSTGKAFQRRSFGLNNYEGTAPPYPCLVWYRYQVTLNQTINGQHIYTYYHYDEFGNVEHTIETGAQSLPNDERTTTITYNPSVDTYIVGLPWRVTISEGVWGTASIKPPSRVTYYCYDGDNGSDLVNCPGKPTKGMMTATQMVDDQGFYVTTRYFYDHYGNLTGMEDANHHGTSIFYDQTYHIYPVKKCNALPGQCEEMEWDYALGRTLSITDLNKQRAEFDYDVFGRLEETISPDTGIRYLEYLDWGDPVQQRVRESVTDGTPNGLWTETYFDGLGRTYRIAREGNPRNLPPWFPPSSTVFMQDTIYADATSLVYQQSHWYESGEKPVYETYEYDAASRLVRQTHPDGTFSRLEYGNNGTQTWVKAYDEVDHSRITYFDAYGRLARIGEINQGKQSDTIYTYDSLDQLLTITDLMGNLTSLQWNMLGFNDSITDLDRGLWSYTYDQVGNIKTQIDARKSTITYTYDELNRPETKSYPDGRLIRWRYDEPNHGAGIGQLTSITDSAETKCPGKKSEDLTYDVMGQVTVQKQCIEGRTYAMGFDYDQMGRLESLTYPNQEVVTYHYDWAGRLHDIPGYVNSMSYDAEDNLTEVEYANKTKASFKYDSSRKWLENANVSLGSSTLYQAGYKYFANGLIQTTSSSTNKMNLTFSYDDMDRLGSVSGDFSQTFHYDAVGNITYNSEIGTYAYLSPVTGTGCGTVATTINPCPHAVKSTSSTQISQEFKYDANGNLTLAKRKDSNKQKQRLIRWNADNQPSMIQDFKGNWTHFRYDSEGQRVYSKRNQKVTLYYGDYLEASYQAGSSNLKKIQYYYAGPILVARKDSAGTYWYHQDNLGSTRLMTNKSGKVIAKYDYLPFGEMASNSGTVSTDIQFTGHRTDMENELIYMNARYYDPHLARFISADSVIPDNANPQSLNRYSYVYNNPARYTDPSGHQGEVPIPDYPMGIDLVNNYSWYTDESGGLHMEYFNALDVPSTAPYHASDNDGIRAYGISLEFSFIFPLLSGGGGSYGINLEYTFDEGLGLYTYGTPQDVPSHGFLIGPSLTGNIATGAGAWSGLFDSVAGSAVLFAPGYFQSPETPGGDPGYAGLSFGIGKGPPGVGSTTTNYTHQLSWSDFKKSLAPIVKHPPLPVFGH